MTTVKITDATVEPITLAEARLHVKADGTDDDTLITALIKAVRLACEHETGRTMLDTTYRCTLDSFPDAIRLDFPRLISVTSVEYTDTNGATQTLAPGDYVVDSDSLPGYIVPAHDKAWPDTQDQINAVCVTYKAGYGTTADKVPENLKLWMKLHLGHFYLNRESSAVGQIVALPFFASLLDSEIIYTL